MEAFRLSIQVVNAPKQDAKERFVVSVKGAFCCFKGRFKWYMSAYTNTHVCILGSGPVLAAVVVVKLRPPWSLSGERPCGFPFLFLLFIFCFIRLYKTNIRDSLQIIYIKKKI